MTLGGYLLLKWAHVMLFGFAVGAALGRGVASLTGNRAWQGLSLQLQRTCIVFLLPVGYLLALQTGLVRLPTPFIAALGIVAALWVWAVIRTPPDADGPTSHRWQRIELGWCLVLSGGLVWDAIQGFRRTGHLYADWLALKFLLFALLILVTAFGARRAVVQSAVSLALLGALAWVSIARPAL